MSGDWLPALTGAGAFGLLVALIGYLFAANRTDRRDYRSALRAEEKAHDLTQQRLDEERERRRKAEDMLAETGRQLAALRGEVAHANELIAKLQAQMAGLTGNADGAR